MPSRGRSRHVARERLAAVTMAAVVVLFRCTSLASEGNGATVMLGAGLYNREYVEAAQPGIWQVLCSTAKGVTLLSAQVDVKTVRAPVFDEATEPDPEKSGRLIEVPSCSSPVIVLRRAGLRDGAVATAFVGSATLPSDVSLRLRLGSETYGLAARRDPTHAQAVDVILTSGDASHAISRITGCCNDTWPSILWAGDLDRDGKLDLLLELSAHYAGSQLTLFLSSAARGGDPVGEVARFLSGSC
jgi:hypothetical protein